MLIFGNISHPLLAANSEVGWIFGVIFAVVWAILGAANAASKKQEEKRRALVRESLTTPLPTATAPLQRPPILAEQIRMRIPKTALPRIDQRKPPMTKHAALASARSSKPPPVPRKPGAPRLAAIVDAKHQEISATEIRSPGAGAARASTSANAVAIRRWLTPATLRQQYILTEVLQKPLALREPS